MALSGVDHITISPPLLRLLISSTASSVPSLFDSPPSKPPQKLAYESEAAYRMAFTRSNGGDGEGERKLVQVRFFLKSLLSTHLSRQVRESPPLETRKRA